MLIILFNGFDVSLVFCKCTTNFIKIFLLLLFIKVWFVMLLVVACVVVVNCVSLRLCSLLFLITRWSRKWLS